MSEKSVVLDVTVHIILLVIMLKSVTLSPVMPPKKTCKKINYHFNCNSKCLIYLFSCKVCGKQYVGFTTDKFRYQWYNYKNCQHNAEKEEHHMQKQLPDQFLSEDHDGLLNNVEITPIDKTDPWKKREILED